MTNQDSAVQVLIPNIPPGVCFAGTTRDILNQFITQVLNNLTISGLPDIDPATVAQIQSDLQNLQNQIDLFNPQVRSSSLSLTTGDQTIPISFATPMPDTNYYMVVELNDTAGAATAVSGWNVVSGTKATTGISLRFTDIPASVTSFTYFAVRATPN